MLFLQGFSFLAIATSFIGFVLALTDFFQDALTLPNDQRYISYALSVVPPYIFAMLYPDIFFQALDVVRHSLASCMLLLLKLSSTIESECSLTADLVLV